MCLDLSPVCSPSAHDATKVNSDGDGSLLRSVWEEGDHQYQDLTGNV